MSAMTQQTKRAVAAFMAAGFGRGEFSVRCPCVNGAYQPLVISVWTSDDKVIRGRVPALLENGISVREIAFLTKDGGSDTSASWVFGDPYFEDGRGRYCRWTIDCRSEREELVDVEGDDWKKY
jgi:hypothetical protein